MLQQTTNETLLNSDLLTFHVIDEKIKKLSKERTSLKAKIIKAMGENTEYSNDYLKAILSIDQREILDTKKVKSFLGDRLPVFQKTSTVKTLTVRGK